jgi:ATP-dependent exoDNAse (exonuclease V) beta subunit
MTTAQTDVGQEPIEVDKPEADDVSLWSVTTIIGALDKPALMYWAAQQTAEAAIDSHGTWQAMVEESGRDEAAKWLRDARFRSPKTKLSAADLGTATHKVCETYALTGTRPDRDFITELVTQKGGRQLDVKSEVDTVDKMLNQFDGWLQRFTPSYQATEVTVYSPTYGYAGQADGFLTIDGVRFLIDYKTTRDPYDSRGKLKTPYPEQVALQLSAYRHAEHAAVWRPRRFEKFRRRYYLLSATERELAVPVPEVDTGLVIQLSPESCESYPIRCDEEVHTAFLYVLEAFRWLQETSKTVMRDPLTPTGAE